MKYILVTTVTTLQCQSSINEGLWLGETSIIAKQVDPRNLMTRELHNSKKEAHPLATPNNLLRAGLSNIHEVKTSYGICTGVVYVGH